MRVGVISDIHGNNVALLAALDDLRRYEVDQIVCLGDAVQGGCEPREVVDTLKELGCPVIIGNADAFVLSGAVETGATESVSDPMREVRDWTVAQLGEDGLDFLRTFTPTHEIQLEGETLLCFHGSPTSFDGVLLPEMPATEVEDALVGDARVMCGGHTHIPWMLRMRDKTFFNPGSIGLAYNRMMEQEEFYIYPIAQYAILTSEDGRLSIEFKQVPYDVDALVAAALASGRPYAESEAKRYRPPSQS